MATGKTNAISNNGGGVETATVTINPNMKFSANFYYLDSEGNSQSAAMNEMEFGFTLTVLKGSYCCLLVHYSVSDGWGYTGALERIAYLSTAEGQCMELYYCSGNGAIM